MPIESFAQRQEEAKTTRRKRVFQDDVIMLVVGAEDGAMIIHDYEGGSYVIRGENTVEDLRSIGVNVEDWADRKLIAPLGQLAERDGDGMVDVAEPIEEEEPEGAETAATVPDPAADSDTPTPGLTSLPELSVKSGRKARR